MQALPAPLRRAAQRLPNRKAHYTQRHRQLAKQVKARDGACVRCGATEHLTLDYIVPLSKGGTMTEANAQTLCRRCNASKGNG
jgi:5-methylcytosine-specific restriction endonuclease McrA